MTPDHGREGAVAFGDDEIRGHGAALGTGVGDVVDRDIAALVDGGFLDAQGRFLIVVEVAEGIGVLGEEGNGHRRD